MIASGKCLIQLMRGDPGDSEGDSVALKSMRKPPFVLSTLQGMIYIPTLNSAKMERTEDETKIP